MMGELKTGEDSATRRRACEMGHPPSFRAQRGTGASGADPPAPLPAPVSRSQPPRIENRHGKMKFRALPDFAFHPDAPAVPFHQVLGDRESQSGAAHFP